MAISNIKLLFSLLVICLITGQAFAQNSFASLGESDFSIEYEFSDFYSIDLTIEPRYEIYEDDEFAIANQHIDVELFQSYRISKKYSVDLGIQYRFREEFGASTDEFRLTEQFNITKKFLAFRFGHRFRLEQRFFEKSTEIRSRYRFGLDFPLNGEELDVGEAYFATSSEFLYSVGNDTKPELDNRTGAHIGWQLSESLNFQVGLQYRFVTFNIATEHQLYFLSSVEIRL